VMYGVSSAGAEPHAMVIGTSIDALLLLMATTTSVPSGPWCAV